VGNEVVSILGPSGSVKSLTLRLIAGILRPDAGRIVLDGRVLYDSQQGIDLPSRQRRIGFVFQNYALFPHLTVEENISYGIRHWPGARRRARVQELIKLMRLAGLEREYPARLSGGQQQRVAVARALAPQPDLLLLDEPFSALDNRVRERLVQEFAQLSRELGITALLVTHNLEEAYTLSSRIAVMEGGQVRQFGSRADILRRPCCRAVARFTGARNIFDGEVLKKEGAYSLIRGERFSVVAPAITFAPGEKVAFAIRPEDVILMKEEEVPDKIREAARPPDLIRPALTPPLVPHAWTAGDTVDQPRSGQKAGVIPRPVKEAGQDNQPGPTPTAGEAVESPNIAGWPGGGWPAGDGATAWNQLATPGLENIFLATLLEERSGTGNNILFVSLSGPKKPADYDLELVVPRNIYRFFDLAPGKTFWLRLPPESIWVWREDG